MTLLVHVGYHKTATKWLQTHVFGAGVGGFVAPCEFMDVVDRIVRPDPLLWDADETRTWLDERVATAGRGVPVISCEELLGNPHAGARDATMLADRLRALQPDARILIVIREQRALIGSAWRQYVRRGGVLPLARYLSPPPAHFRVPAFRLEHFEYDRIIELYRARFDEVLVLPMELLSSERASFLGRLASFAGTGALDDAAEERVNTSLSPLACTIQRQLNRFLLRDDVNPSAPLHFGGLRGWCASVDRRLPDAIGRIGRGTLSRTVDRVVGDRYRESNRRTADMIGCDLAELGYDV